MTSKQARRVNKYLAQLRRYNDGGIMSIADNLKLYPPVRKSVYTQTYSDKRVCLEYKKLAKPKKFFTLWRADDTGTSVPKYVYDSFDLPESTGTDT